ncbi:MAG: alkaline phosphatase family protein [Candidatus Sumerlaeia bacterium]|nr:alkaline phosphatase family protein [Candidatus Sumerlaeia bacterium]
MAQCGSIERLFVLGLDGVPFSFLKRGMASGRLPHLRELARRADMKQIASELPAVSSVAWTSFVTGSDPATHGIFGFVDRIAETGDLFIPTARNRRAAPVWVRLSDRGRPAVSINVPGAYPPEAIRGCVVAGFLCPSPDRAAVRPDVAARLQEINYVVDVDASLGKAGDKEPFLAALHKALTGRRDLALWLLEHEPWDFFQLHIMETDRLHHFLWDAADDENHPHHAAFWEFYRAVDELAGEVICRVADTAHWMVLSDHGFARSHCEVNVNALLRDLGFLQYTPAETMNLDPVADCSRVFSLLPGRIFINRAGRERRGCVQSDKVESLMKDIADALLETRHPATGGAVFDRIVRTRDIYPGPLRDLACDLIAVGRDGFDLRAGFRTTDVFAPPSQAGTHTSGDAFVLAGEGILRGDEATIRDVGRRVMEIMLP